MQDSIQSLRHDFHDAPMLHNMWEMSRLQAFIQRPNIFTRANLRDSLASLTKLRRSGGSNAALVRGGGRGGRHPHRGTYSGSDSSYGGMLPCLGLHVRHGDALQDTRGELNLTRTLAAHMSCASKLTSELSLPNIFLASDNNTLFDIVARKYPQFNWYAQKRVIKAYDGNMYQHMNEKSHNKEIANLLVS